jgi:hypothetical protein
VFKVARHEDARRRSGKRFVVVHLRGRVVEIGDLANSGVRRVKAQVLGVRSREARGHEATKERDGL